MNYAIAILLACVWAIRVAGNPFNISLTRVNSRFSTALFFLLFSCFGSWAPDARGQELYSVSPKDKLLRRIDPETGATISSVEITAIGPFNGVSALAVHPETHQLWGVLHGNWLVTIDPTTGVTDSVGGIGDRIAGLAFDDDGVLYGVGGHDSDDMNPRKLFTLDQTNGRRTEAFTFPFDGGPRTLGFDFDSGLLYRASGIAGSPRLESLDLSSLELTEVPLSNSWQGEPRAMTFDGRDGFFLAAGFKDKQGGEDFLYRLSTDGTPTLIGPLDHRAKGLALVPLVVPEPTTLTLLAAGLILLGLSWRGTKASRTRLAFCRCVSQDRFPKPFFVPLLVLLVSSFASTPPDARGQELYSVSPKDKLLRRLDPETGATISSVEITTLGDPFNGVKSLAVHPETRQLWAVLNGFRLATIDSTTGVADEVLNLGDAIAGLAFDDAGVLYGVGGHDSNGLNPRKLFLIDVTSGQRTDAFTFPFDGGPRTLGFDFDSRLLFRASGSAGSPRLQSLDLSSLELTEVPLSASWQGEPRAMTFDDRGGFFLASGFKDNQGGEDFLYRLTTDGTPTLIGPLDHRAKGLALVPFVVPEPTTLTLLAAGFAILALSRRSGRRQRSRLRYQERR